MNNLDNEFENEKKQKYDMCLDVLISWNTELDLLDMQNGGLWTESTYSNIMGFEHLRFLTNFCENFMCMNS